MRGYVPLSRRSPQEIRAMGQMYQDMAATARSAAAKRSLELLARRCAALANRRESEKLAIPVLQTANG